MLALNSKFPMCVMWGEKDLIQIYNDYYIPFLSSARHPAGLYSFKYSLIFIALGQPCKLVGVELWNTVSHLLEKVMETGVSCFYEDCQFNILNKDLLEEERYFTFSYSPIHDGDRIVTLLHFIC